MGPFAAGWHELINAHMTPWRAAVCEAGLGGVMPSYAAVEGSPCHGNHALLTEQLRERLGFDGIVVSDYGGVAELHDLHLVAASPAEAAERAILAGMDCELPDGECYGVHLAALAERDSRVADAVDRSAARVLRVKFRLGLFERPYVDEARALDVPAMADEDAAQGAVEGIILLKNDDGLLPLDPAKLKRVAVIGPHANENILGPYFGMPRYQDNYVDAIRRTLDGIEVVYEEGCRIAGPAIEPDAGEQNLRDPGKDHSVARLSTPADDAESIERAVAAARGSDVVVLCVGDSFATTKESFRARPHGDRADLGLLGSQRYLYGTLRETGVPMVVVLLRMGVIADAELFTTASTLLDAGCGGQAGPAALASVLVGETEPEGRLPVSVPWSAEYLPAFAGAPAAARRGYGFCADQVAFPLGYGLSYTSWSLAEPKLSADHICIGEPAVLTVAIRNTGRRKGSEVVQVYHHDCCCPLTRPARELVAFTRVTLDAGGEESLTLDVPAERMGWYDHEGRPRQEPGEHHFWISIGSDPRGGEMLALQVVV